MTPGNHPSSTSWNAKTINTGSVVAGGHPFDVSVTTGYKVGGDVHVYLATDDGFYITTDDGYRILLETIPGNSVPITLGNHATIVTK